MQHHAAEVDVPTDAPTTATAARPSWTKALADRLAADPGVAAAWLHGSVLTERQPRDVDIAVLAIAGADPWTVVRRLRDELEAALAASPYAALPLDLRPVDHRAPPSLRYKLVHDGVLLCEPDREARVLFQADAARDWLDVEPGLRVARQVWLERLAAGNG